jgi:PBP1b-binding outer membrane lipoprotein LpoB
MKAIIVRLNLIVAVVIAAFLYAGCGAPGGNNTPQANTNTSANTSNTSTTSNESSAYPPLATAVAQGELEAHEHVGRLVRAVSNGNAAPCRNAEQISRSGFSGHRP